MTPPAKSERDTAPNSTISTTIAVTPSSVLAPAKSSPTTGRRTDSPGARTRNVARAGVPGSSADGRPLSRLRLETETGFYLLAIRRGGRYLYRPRANVVLQADDQLIATGPDEGHRLLAELCGYVLIEDEETGEDELVPAGAGH